MWGEGLQQPRSGVPTSGGTASEGVEGGGVSLAGLRAPSQVLAAFREGRQGREAGGRAIVQGGRIFVLTLLVAIASREIQTEGLS